MRYARPLVRDGAGDEIYVKAPVLMVVEQESLCWVCGQLSETVSGEAWSQEFARLPNLEQLARDGGRGLAKGVALVNAQRQEQGQEPIVDQGDHFHALRNGGVGLRQGADAGQHSLGRGRDRAKSPGRMRAGKANRGRSRPCVPATRGRRRNEPWMRGRKPNVSGNRPRTLCC